MNAATILFYGNRTLMSELDSLPKAHWNTPGACGWWSVRDIVAHLASYELVLVDVLTSFLGGGPTQYLDKMATNADGFNDLEVKAREGKSNADTFNEYKAAHETTMVLIQQIPPDTLQQVGTLPWYGAEYSLDDYLVYAFYGHKREHGAQIAAFGDIVKHRSES